METFWNIFWPIFWVMVFVGLSLFFFYTIRILKDISSITNTANNVSDQIQAIADLVDDIRTKANMGVFIDVLELSKRLFFKFKGKEEKHHHHKHHDDEEDED